MQFLFSPLLKQHERMSLFLVALFQVVSFSAYRSVFGDFSRF